MQCCFVTCGSSRNSLCSEAVEDEREEREGDIDERGTESCLQRLGRFNTEYPFEPAPIV